MNRSYYHLTIPFFIFAAHQLHANTELAYLVHANTELAYLALAHALRDEGNYAEAIAHYKNTLKKNPKNSDALFNLGYQLFKQGAIDEALPYLQQRSELEPVHDQTEFFLGLSYGTKNTFDKAAYHLTRAANLNTSLPKIHDYLGTALEKQNKLDAALEQFYKAANKNPNNYNAHFHIGIILRQQGHFTDALSAYDKTITLQPHYQPALLEKANTLTLLGQIDEALAIYTQLLEMNANIPTTLYNIAFALKKQGNYDKAIEIYKKVITVSPNNKQALLGLAHSYLAIGDFEHGWSVLATYNSLGQPAEYLLKNNSNLYGKTIFVGAEWDHSDTIMLIRYAQQLKKYGCTVIVQTPHNLVKLFKNCSYIDQVVSTESGETHPFNRYVPLSSLPAIFGSTLESVPANSPYLCADDKTIQFWKKIIDRDTSKLKVGLFLKTHDKNMPLAEQRNIPPQVLAPLASLEGISFYNLQSNRNPFDFHGLPTTFITHYFGQGFSENDEDFLQLAAIIQQIDLVITADSHIAHLAGAVGTKAYVLLPYKADWRWMQNRTDSPWYPTLKLFRQKEAGNWNDLIPSLMNELAILLQNK